MADKPKKTSDPFERLPRPSRYVDSENEIPDTSTVEHANRQKRVPVAKRGKKTPKVIACKVAKTRADEIASKLDEPAQHAKKPLKRGRPVKHTDEPWKALGISRATWFRRQKEGK